MKTKYLYLTTIFLLGLSAPPVPAQTEPGSFDGIQSSVNQNMDDAAEPYESLKPKFDENVRKWMLRGFDICMTMEVKTEKETDGFNPGGVPYLMFETSKRDASLYAEFDWQNQAESMRLEPSEFKKSWTAFNLIGGEETVAANDFYMYVDALGYWYVPFDEYGTSYIRVEPFGAMQSIAKMLEVGIEAAIDAKVTDMLDELGFLMALNIGYSEYKDMITEFIPQEVLNEYMGQLTQEYKNGGWVPKFDDTQNVTEKKLKSVLKELAKSKFEEIKGFPPFIHFAYIISPTLAQSQFDVKEETVTWGGIDYCTKMTVLSGKDAGYQVVFDDYGRLVHLRDTDGSTADYTYDKDVTVNIPPATTINMGEFIPSMSTK